MTITAKLTPQPTCLPNPLGARRQRETIQLIPFSTGIDDFHALLVLLLVSSLRGALFVAFFVFGTLQSNSRSLGVGLVCRDVCMDASQLAGAVDFSDSRPPGVGMWHGIGSCKGSSRSLKRRDGLPGRCSFFAICGTRPSHPKWSKCYITKQNLQKATRTRSWEAGGSWRLQPSSGTLRPKAWREDVARVARARDSPCS